MKKGITLNDYLNAKNELYNNADSHRWSENGAYSRILENYTLDRNGELVYTAEGDLILHKINVLSDKRRNAILSSKTDITFSGKSYYVSENGNDLNDGLSPENPWKTLKRVNEFDFQDGDAVFFNRGDIFRGNLNLHDGVTYSAYGTGKKPEIYGSPENGANPEKWTLVDKTDNIWVYANEMTDVGLIVFNDGEEYTRRTAASYINGRYTVRNSTENKPFDVRTDLDDMEIFSCCDNEKVNGFPTRMSKGKIYLRSDRGNPGEIFNSIEFNTCGNILNCHDRKNVTVDNLCIKYGGSHGIGAGHVKNLTVQNCEIGWIGGSVQLYNKENGKATIYGNGIEVFGDCDGYYVTNNYVYQCYDAGITHQQGAGGGSYEFKDVVYKDNLVEDCIYSIEYFMSSAQDSQYTRNMKNILMENNILRRAGYGFGIQRPDDNLSSNIMGWWTSLNKAENFVIKNNIFDRGVHTLLQINADFKEFLPKLENNTYLQNIGKFFGRFGFDNKNVNYYTTQEFYNLKVKEFIKSIDSEAKIYFVK